jgi:hypothetical protein
MRFDQIEDLAQAPLCQRGFDLVFRDRCNRAFGRFANHAPRDAARCDISDVLTATDHQDCKRVGDFIGVDQPPLACLDFNFSKSRLGGNLACRPALAVIIARIAPR